VFWLRRFLRFHGRCHPRSIHVFPAASIPGGSGEFVNADAMTLPFPDATIDLAVMTLLIFFVAVLSEGVAEILSSVGWSKAMAPRPESSASMGCVIGGPPTDWGTSRQE